MNALQRLVASSDDPEVQRQWEALEEGLNYIYGVMPSHELDEPFEEEVRMGGDDLAGALHRLDIALTIVCEHPPVRRQVGSQVCLVCYWNGEVPHHRDADDMTRRGLL